MTFDVLVIKRVLISGLEVLSASYIDVLIPESLSLLTSLAVLISIFGVLCTRCCELVVVFIVSIASVDFVLTPSPNGLGTIFDVIILSVVDRSNSGDTRVVTSALDEMAFKFVVLNSNFCEVRNSSLVDDIFWSAVLCSTFFVDALSEGSSVLASPSPTLEDICFNLEVEISNFLDVVTNDGIGVLASTFDDFGAPLDIPPSGLFVEETCDSGSDVVASYFEEASFAYEELTSSFLVEARFSLDELASTFFKEEYLSSPLDELSFGSGVLVCPPPFEESLNNGI